MRPKGVFFGFDTVGEIVRLYKKFKKKIKRFSGDALFCFVYDKFSAVYDCAVKICSSAGISLAERCAFEICRHTRFAATDKLADEICADVFGKDLAFLSAVRDEMSLKRCQLFCLAASMLLSGDRRAAESYLAALFDTSFAAGFTTSLDFAEMTRDNTVCKIYSSGNFTVTRGVSQVTMKEDKFPLSDGVRFDLFENNVSLKIKTTRAAFGDKMFVCEKESGTLFVRQTCYFNGNGFVCSLDVANRGQKTRQIRLLALADFALPVKNVFCQNGVYLFETGGKWFCVSCDRKQDISRDENMRLFAEVRVKAKDSATVNFCFAVFDKMTDAAVFVSRGGVVWFYAKDFLFVRPSVTSAVCREIASRGGGVSFDQTLACERRDVMRKNSLYPICGYNTDSFVSDRGEIFSVGDKLFTSPRFGGERVYVRVDGRTYMLCDGKAEIKEDKIVFRKKTLSADFTLEISHFGGKNYKIICDGAKGGKTLSVMLCLDFFYRLPVSVSGRRIALGEYTLDCPTECEVVTSSKAFDKFAPDFDFCPSVCDGDICAVKCAKKFDGKCVLNFCLKRSVNDDALADAFCVQDNSFWDGGAINLSATLIHASLKKITLFSLPSLAYVNGRYLKDILEKLSADGFTSQIITSGSVKKYDVSRWAFYLGAVWFVCMYPDDEYSRRLLKFTDEMFLTPVADGAEALAKALCCLKICRHVVDKVSCLTAAENAKNLAVRGGNSALAAYICGLTEGKISGVKDIGGLYDFASRSVTDVDRCFLSVMLLENFAGIKPDGGEVSVTPRFDGHIDNVRGKFFGKAMSFDFRKGAPPLSLNGGEIASRFIVKGLGEASFFDVGY